MQSNRRDKGDGSIYQRKSDGKWVAKYTPSSGAKTKVLYGNSEQEVKKKLREYKKEIAKNDFVEIQKITVEKYMNDWLYNIEANVLKPKSFDRKESTLINDVYPHIGCLQIANISSNDVQNMINKLVAKKLSYSGIKKAYDAVNKCFKLGVVKGDIIKNPCVGVVLPKNLKKSNGGGARFFTDEEMRLISKESIAKHGNGRYVYRLGNSIILLLNTGVRAGELLALRWTDINFTEKTMNISSSMVMVKNREEDAVVKWVTQHQESTKTMSSSRIISLNQKAMSALKELYDINGKHEYVMSTSTKAVMSHRSLDRMFRSILSRCNIEPCGVHVCRHSFGSALLRRGVDIKVIAELLGHSDVGFCYNTYVHLIREQKQEAIEVLD